MKKFLSSALVASLVLSLGSCGNSKLKEAQERNLELEGDVTSLVATQDSLLSLVNDISEGMSQIKDLERIISTPGSLDNETPSRKEQIKNDMIAIHKALEERRTRLDELEKKLQATGQENTTLSKTVQTLKAQIAEQQTEITQLNNQLAAAHIQIEELNTTVTEQKSQIEDLNQAVETQSRERELAQEETQRVSSELNACYYCIGSSSELKKNKIMEAGFLRKTKIMSGDFNANYFTKADKRSLTTINTHARKAEIMTNNPKDSYTISTVGNEKVINITNPARFWSLSNFLVIKVN